MSSLFFVLLYIVMYFAIVIQALNMGFEGPSLIGMGLLGFIMVSLFIRDILAEYIISKKKKK